MSSSYGSHSRLPVDVGSLIIMACTFTKYFVSKTWLKTGIIVIRKSEGHF